MLIIGCTVGTSLVHVIGWARLRQRCTEKARTDVSVTSSLSTLEQTIAHQQLGSRCALQFGLDTRCWIYAFAPACGSTSVLRLLAPEPVVKSKRWILLSVRQDVEAPRSEGRLRVKCMLADVFAAVRGLFSVRWPLARLALAPRAGELTSRREPKLPRRSNRSAIGPRRR